MQISNLFNPNCAPLVLCSLFLPLSVFYIVTELLIRKYLLHNYKTISIAKMQIKILNIKRKPQPFVICFIFPLMRTCGCVVYVSRLIFLDKNYIFKFYCKQPMEGKSFFTRSIVVIVFSSCRFGYDVLSIQHVLCF